MKKAENISLKELGAFDDERGTVNIGINKEINNLEPDDKKGYKNIQAFMDLSSSFEFDKQKIKEDTLNEKVEQCLKDNDLHGAGSAMIELLQSSYDVKQEPTTFKTTQLWILRYYNEFLSNAEFPSRTEKNIQEILDMHDEKFLEHTVARNRKKDKQYKSEYFEGKELEELDDIFVDWVANNGYKNRKSPQAFFKEIKEALKEYSTIKMIPKRMR